jgi:hypothetical protein
LKRRTVKRVYEESWDENLAGPFHVDAEGRYIVIFNECGEFDYCDGCISPDGRRWSLESVDHGGLDPIFLLSTQELEMLERLIHQL